MVIHRTVGWQWLHTRLDEWCVSRHRSSTVNQVWCADISDIAVFVLKRDVKLQPTNQPCHVLVRCLSGRRTRLQQRCRSLATASVSVVHLDSTVCWFLAPGPTKIWLVQPNSDTSTETVKELLNWDACAKKTLATVSADVALVATCMWVEFTDEPQ